MGCRVAVPDSVAGRKQCSALTKVNTEVGEGFVLSSGVCSNSADKEVDCSRSNRGGEGLDLTDLVRVLPQALLAERSEEVECTVFVKVILIEELSRALLEKSP